MAHVTTEFGIGRAAAYRSAVACVERGPIAREDSLRRESSMVELTPRAPRCLQAIVRAWRRSPWIAEVR